MCIIGITVIVTTINTLVGKFIYKHWIYFVFELSIDLTNALIFVLAHFEGLYYTVSFKAICITTTCLYGLIGFTLFWSEFLLYI